MTSTISLPNVADVLDTIELSLSEENRALLASNLTRRAFALGVAVSLNQFYSDEESRRTISVYLLKTLVATLSDNGSHRPAGPTQPDSLITTHAPTIIPHAGLESFPGAPVGHGIFVDTGANRMNVGAILPIDGGKFLLTITIIPEMALTEYQPCDLSEVYEGFNEAATAARSFLMRHRRS